MVGMDRSQNNALTQALIELEQHVARDGWDQATRLFALVDTAELIAAEPRLAAALAPETVDGAALVIERLMLPPSAQEQVPDDQQDADAWVAAHPERQEVRIAVGVLRDGSRDCALRLRSKDKDDEVLSGADLVPNLVRALADTLQD